MIKKRLFLGYILLLAIPGAMQISVAQSTGPQYGVVNEVFRSSGIIIISGKDYSFGSSTVLTNGDLTRSNLSIDDFNSGTTVEFVAGTGAVPPLRYLKALAP